MTRVWRSRLGSISSKGKVEDMNPQLRIEFEVGKTLELRPEFIVRGLVILTIRETNKTIWASVIKINFRGEETVSAKVKLGSARQTERTRTIFFQCSQTVWSGSENIRAIPSSPWQGLTPGEYRFPFALNIPPVNFPPSIEGPRSLSIKYVWQPIIEGPGGYRVEGPETFTPFVPITFAPKDQEWTFKEIIYQDENKTTKKQVIEVEAKLPRHVLSPGRPFKFTLSLTNHSGGRITHVQCSLRKHYEGPLGKEFVCEKHERSLDSTEKRCNIEMQQTRDLEIILRLPKKASEVPPTYTGHHLRVYYTIRCVIQTELGKFLMKLQYHEAIIPISIAAYPHITDDVVFLKSYPLYTESRLSPYFFNPNKDLPLNTIEEESNGVAVQTGSINLHYSLNETGLDKKAKV